MRIMVTGGAGFIGSNLVKKLLMSTDNEIINIDKLTYAGSEVTAEKLESANHFFHKLDICDYSAIKQLVSQYHPDAVIHLAAESHVDRSIAGPDEFVNTNIVGTVNLLKIFSAYWQSLEPEAKKKFRFLHVSTDEVFGDLSEDSPKFSEQTPYQPSSPYSASKAASDHMVRAWHRTYGLPVLISNCSNNYGPFQFPEKLIPLAITRLLNGQQFGVYGDGNQIRDWLYVEDHVDALITILKHGVVGESYNIGGDSELRNIDLLQIICEYLAQFEPSKTAADYKALLVRVTDRPGHDRRYAIDNRKITETLGWAPKHQFTEAITNTIKWYLNNQDWCNRILNRNE